MFSYGVRSHRRREVGIQVSPSDWFVAPVDPGVKQWRKLLKRATYDADSDDWVQHFDARDEGGYVHEAYGDMDYGEFD